MARYATYVWGQWGDVDEVFDGAAGVHHLYIGYGGDDVYLLGHGTNHDRISESFGGGHDVIRLKDGFTADQVRMRRSDDGRNLYVELLDDDGEVSDSLRVDRFYRGHDYRPVGFAKVERVELWDGTLLWDEADMMAEGSGAPLLGSNGWRDTFDPDLGRYGHRRVADDMRGRGGDDQYWLRLGSGHDTVNEWYLNDGRPDSNRGPNFRAGGGRGQEFSSGGGPTMGDEIFVAGSSDRVRLRRSDDGADLHVEMMNDDGSVLDSITVKRHFIDPLAKVEWVRFSSGVDWGLDVLDAAKKGGESEEDNVLRLGDGQDGSNVFLARSKDGADLVLRVMKDGRTVDEIVAENHYIEDNARIDSVELADGTALWGATDFAAARVLRVGTSEGEDLRGDDGNDVFDGDAGGDDVLYGYGGNDVYWLGYGTGRDTVNEYSENGGDAGDVIKIKAGIAPDQVRLWRSDDGKDLHVELLDDNGDVSDSMAVASYFVDASAKVESVVFADGTFWGADILDATSIIGTGDNDVLRGGDGKDVFDAVGGDDDLHGGAGDDVYWLGYGTGHDSAHEFEGNKDGDAIRLKSDVVLDRVRLRRSDDRRHLLVELLDGDGNVADSLIAVDYYVDLGHRIERVESFDGSALWGESDFAAAGYLLIGTSDDENLAGDEGNDIFDAVGGDDILHGKGGDDVYWLGVGTGHDTIKELFGKKGAAGDGGDVIKIKGSVDSGRVRLRRSDDGKDLHVELLGDDGHASDSLVVAFYFAKDAARVESVKFADGTVWGADILAAAPIIGGPDKDRLIGSAGRDVFDGVGGGDDTLRGKGGDDVYWLGYGTGEDAINEYRKNSGDFGDVIKVKDGIAPDRVRFRASNDGKNLRVELLGDDGEISDALIVKRHYVDASARVERLEFANGVVWNLADMPLSGGKNDDKLRGSTGRDVFDGAAGGDDDMFGKSGNDVYLLGFGAGDDKIYEHRGNNEGGDTGDAIHVKAGILPGQARLRRSDNGKHLHVELLGDDGKASDSLTVRQYFVDASAKVESVVFADGTFWGADILDAASIIGTGDNDVLRGGDGKDVFDAVGGDDDLHGGAGDDVYWLGYGTGHDSAHEFEGNKDGDAIRLKSDVVLDRVRLRRSDDRRHLLVELLDGDGNVADSLIAVDYYVDLGHRIERVESFDGSALWGESDFAAAGYLLIGTSDDENLAGDEGNDIFDAVGGDDILHGKGGDDVYWLGVGTGHDTVNDLSGNDVIKIKGSVDSGRVRLRRSDDGKDLHVELLGDDGEASDSLIMASHFVDDAAKAESVVFADGTVWGASKLDAARKSGEEGDNVIRLGAGYDATNVILAQSEDGAHLVLRLMKDGRTVDEIVANNHYVDDDARIERVEKSDGTTLWSEADFSAAPRFASQAGGVIGRGGKFGDVFLGNQEDGKKRVFDSGRGDDSHRAGDDNVYWLGYGTGHDTAGYFGRDRPDGNNVIKIKPGILPGDVRLRRHRWGFHVDLLNEDGEISDSLTAEWRYNGRERIEFADGTTWGAKEIVAAPELRGKYLRAGTSGDDLLHDRSMDDVYYLGYGTGKDRVVDVGGDDAIKIKGDVALESVRLRRSYNSLHVELLIGGEVSDSLEVDLHFSSRHYQAERIEAGDKALLARDYQALIDEIAAFTAGASDFDSIGDIHAHYWRDIDNSLASPAS